MKSRAKGILTLCILISVGLIAPFLTYFRDAERVIQRETILQQYESPSMGGVLILETDSVKIKANVENVIQYLENFFDKHHIGDDKTLADMLLSEASVVTQYNYDDFSARERERLMFCVAALLGLGKCLIQLESGATCERYAFCVWDDGLFKGRKYLLPDGRGVFQDNRFYSVTSNSAIRHLSTRKTRSTL